MNISVIGTGYVGLVIGTCFANKGHNVICVDNDNTKLEKLQRGISPIYEPNLEDLIKTGIANNKLHFSNSIEYAVKNSEVCFIAVGTPQDKDGSADLQYVLDVAQKIAVSINDYKVIVDKSTVPVGTAEKITDIIKTCNANAEFDVVSNPEFLRQGSAVNDFLYPERVIIGSNSKCASKIVQELYSYVSDKIILMDVKSAEMTKYAANSFLAVKISFINEIANLCERVQADVESVKRGLASDSRIGGQFLSAGLGYGGSCFPKDVKALIKIGEDCGYDMKIIKAAKEVNTNQKCIFINKIISKFGNDLAGKIFAIWGLSYKPNTDDMREAPSIMIINELLAAGATVRVSDPKACETVKKIFADRIEYSQDKYSILNGCSALLVLTEWEEYINPDFEIIKDNLHTPVIFDGRNIYDFSILKSQGIEYYSTGRNIQASESKLV